MEEAGRGSGLEDEGKRLGGWLLEEAWNSEARLDRWQKEMLLNR